MLAGCGGGERPAPPIAPAREPATTRAAGAGFERVCLRAAGSVTIAVLCPARLPLGGFEAPRNYGEAPCTYLLNLEPRVMLRRAGAVFHLLFGGTCRPWSLRTRGGRWPVDAAAARAGEDLRLVGITSEVPGDPGAGGKRVGLRVLKRTRIGSAPALVLRNPPYPVGGIHGGHLSVVWNAGGAGYAVSGHAVASRDRPDAAPGPEALMRAALTLLRVAASMRPASSGPG